MDGARTTEEAAGRRRTGDGLGADGRTGGDGPPWPRCGGHTGPRDGDGLTVARTRTGADGDDDETTTAAAAAEEGGA